jgi:hypothetical protein
MNAKKPQHLMAFNEPDISSQSGLDPNYAAQLYMEQIQPWGNKGVSLGSPAIVWKLDWMQDVFEWGEESRWEGGLYLYSLVSGLMLFFGKMY